MDFSRELDDADDCEWELRDETDADIVLLLAVVGV